MTLETKRWIIAGLGFLFLLSLVLVQWMETIRKAEEAGLRSAHVSVPASSRECVQCHEQSTPGIIGHWRDSIQLFEHTLAVAYAAAGDFEQAVRTARAALRKTEGRGDPDLSEAMRERLALYQRGEPYREPNVR